MSDQPKPKLIGLLKKEEIYNRNMAMLTVQMKETELKLAQVEQENVDRDIFWSRGIKPGTKIGFGKNGEIFTMEDPPSPEPNPEVATPEVPETAPEVPLPDAPSN